MSLWNVSFDWHQEKSGLNLFCLEAFAGGFATVSQEKDESDYSLYAMNNMSVESGSQFK